ncbi:40S ribosomal protein S5 [Dendrobium catenatum]|uniref:Small ribosomal subunit protein uS7c n=1 Tax=Dendrobium catenatum TaxID=906689 RepID=A0A2I0VRZ5_9ASPA|nr:40S ribosomal protein S5 [Dendrobium catenatum]
MAAAASPVAYVKLFNRWSSKEVEVSNMSVVDYIVVSPSKHGSYLPYIVGRDSLKRFRKAQCPIVERLTNSLMMHGRNNGKKLKDVCIVKHAMDIIHLLIDTNPIQIILDVVINSGPRKDAIRIGSAGVVRLRLLIFSFSDGLINQYIFSQQVPVRVLFEISR